MSSTLPPPQDNPEEDSPQPIYPASEYQPPEEQPGTSSPVSRRRRQGFWGGLLALFVALLSTGKYLFLLLIKFKAFASLVSILISLGFYALFFGPWFAIGLVLMIFLHEMGHVIEIRRQGMKASAPVFIPFVGAAIFQRQHANDALHQAYIGIAGPIAGSIAATVAFVLSQTLHQPVLLSWAYLGFFINLFNLIPLGMLDGGWVLAASSKWFQLVGIVTLVLVAVLFNFGPLIIIIAILSIPVMIERFRQDKSPYYQSVPVASRWSMGFLWLALTIYLGFAVYGSHQLLSTIVPGS